MTYSENEARALVVRSGHLLVECGLVARTWGNISARVSDTHFVSGDPSPLPTPV